MGAAFLFLLDQPMTDETNRGEDEISPLLMTHSALLIRQRAMIEVLMRSVSEIFSQLRVEQLQGLPLAVWSEQVLDESMDSQLAEIAKALPREASRLRSILDSMDEGDDFHLGNGRPH
jgi:hypothetical protein